MPEAGILEVETLELVTGSLSRYRSHRALRNALRGPLKRLRVEQAVRAGATEIHLVLLSTAEAPERAELAWPDRSSRPDAASALVRELANFFGR